ncbi:MAG: hypothetical protein ABEJ00_03330 [Gemmatimonadota bacterium]
MATITTDKGLIGGLLAAGAGLFHLLMGTETLWFQVAAAYETWIAPRVGALPELGGVFIVIGFLFVGARLADLYKKAKDE